jgi:glycosyltransferase involved in cell wall biosynthesis
MSDERKLIRLLTIFNRYLNRGGEEISVEHNADALSSRTVALNHRVLYFNSSDWQQSPRPPAWKQASLMWSNPSSIQRLLRVQQEFPADCWMVHNVFPVGSAAVYRQAKDMHMPIIQCIQNFRPFSVNGYLWAGEDFALGGLKRSYWREIWLGAWQESRIKTAWFALILKAMHRDGTWQSIKSWLAISEFMRDRFIEAGIPAERIFTLRHFHLPEAPKRQPQDGNYFLFLGRLISAKGVKVLLSTWEMLERKYGSGAPRLKIGGEGPLASWVSGEARRLRKVEYVGMLDDSRKAEALAKCEALIAPSLWWEPLGLVAYEAYDHGKPVLAARSGGLAELINHGVTGYLHEPGDVCELADQIMALHRSPSERTRLGDSGRVWLLANAGVERWTERLTEIVEFTVGRSTTPPAFTQPLLNLASE